MANGQSIIEGPHIRVKKCKHGIFSYNRKDLFIGTALDLYGEYTDNEISLLAQVLRRGDTVIDAGANIGTHTIPLSRKVGNEGRVYAFEPSQNNFQFLASNCLLNERFNVEYFRVALSDKKEKIYLAEYPLSAEANHGEIEASKIKSNVFDAEVNAVPIDSLELDKCRLIKIDVEGFEREVLDGAVNTIVNYKPFLYIECQNHREEIIQRVFDLNYKAYWVFSPNYNQNNYFGTRKNVFLNSGTINIFCFHQGSSVAIEDMIEVESVTDSLDDAYIRKIKNLKQSAAAK